MTRRRCCRRPDHHHLACISAATVIAKCWKGPGQSLAKRYLKALESMYFYWEGWMAEKIHIKLFLTSCASIPLSFPTVRKNEHSFPSKFFIKVILLLKREFLNFLDLRCAIHSTTTRKTPT